MEINITINLAHQIEYNSTKEERLDLVKKIIFEIMTNKEKDDFYKFLFNDIKECEQEFGGHQEVINAYETILKSL